MVMGFCFGLAFVGWWFCLGLGLIRAFESNFEGVFLSEPLLQGFRVLV